VKDISESIKGRKTWSSSLDLLWWNRRAEEFITLFRGILMRKPRNTRKNVKKNHAKSAKETKGDGLCGPLLNHFALK
jgi:hypothetical protein